MILLQVPGDGGHRSNGLRDEQDAARSTTRRRHHQADRANPLRVLIVDDQPSFRDAARGLLHARGHEVVAEAGDGHAAVKAVERTEPDAVILDVCLGDESGFDVSRALVAARPGLPVLLMSIDATAATPEQVQAAGACAFLCKAQLPRADLATLWRAN
jgi:DNA-binding NarL/FixJ family response regulator